MNASNEEEVGKAIKESGIPREEVYVVTKVGYVLIDDVKCDFKHKTAVEH